MARRPSRREDFEIAIVCTLPLEFDAVALTFDEIWDEKKLEKAPGDNNTYTLGRIGKHNAILLRLKSLNHYDKSNAAKGLLLSFTRINFIVLTGICGGLPRAGTDSEILLGDVIISKDVAMLDFAGLFSALLAENVHWKPNRKIRSALATLETHHGRRSLQQRAGQILHQVQLEARQRDQTLSRPPSQEDRLFESEYLHIHRDAHDCTCSTNHTCEEARRASCDELHCEPARLVPRKRLLKEDQKDVVQASEFQVFCGRVGLSDFVFKSGSVRDKAAKEHDLIAFDTIEMGILNELPYVLVKGVCDYADGHWNKTWQRYAAATAASTTAALLDLFVKTGKPTALSTEMAVSSPDPDFMRRPEKDESFPSMPHTDDFLISNQEEMDMKHEMDPAQNEVINGSHNGLKLLPRSKTQVLDQVRRLLGHVQGQQQVSKPHSQVALYGEPDTGKTEIARNYADWLQTACPDVKIFWVSASDDVLYRNSYRSIAKQFGIPGYDNPTADISALVNSWLATEFREPWLLIVDDVNDTQMSFPDSNGSILITTRQKYIASWYVPGRQLIEVTEVSESEPYKILRPPLNVPYFDRDFLGAIVDRMMRSQRIIAQKNEETLRLLNKTNQSAEPTSSFPAASLANAGSSDMESDDSSVTDIEVFGEQPASTKLSLPGNNMYSLKHAVTRKPKDKAWCRHRQHRPAESVSLDGDETQSLVSDLVSDMDSFATGSQIFSENPASTKLSSQDEEVDMLKEANHAKPKAENFYSHLADNFDEKEEIKSLISGYEDIQSQDGSRSVRWEVRDAAVSYIAEMLANDPFLEPLYKNAAQRLEGKRFVRNHCRLLKSYYLSLRSQASNQKQGVAIEFLRPRAHRTLISIKIRENMEFQDMRRKEVHVELPQDEGRDLTLERYLSNVGASSKSHTDDTMQAIREADEGRKDNRTTEEQSEDAKSEDAKREDAKREDAKREDVKSEDIKSEESKDEYSQYEEAEEQSEDGWEGKEEGYDTGASLISLGETRSFFVSGQPLVDFRANFQDFLYPKSEAAEGTQPKKTQPKRSHVVSRGARLLARLFDVWSPPKDGCERVRYMCDCGDYTFLDVREISPGGLQRFRQRLASHGLSNIIAASAPSEFPDGLSPPPSAYLGTARSRSVTSQNSGLTSSRRSSLSTQPTSLSWSEDEAPPEDEQTIPQYLLLCVNQKSLPELIHINCRPFHNDQYLCQQILKEYQITRDKSTWRPSLLVHAKLLAVLSGVSSFLEKKTPHCLEWIFRFSRSVSEISFFQMDTGDFVRFQLVPVGELTVPNHFKCAEYPPESEVKAGNYEYEPVPMIDVAIASIPLWHLTRPVQHSDMYWIKTFPKKMRYPLRREPGVYGKPIIGWGIRVNEAFHWKHFLFLILAVSIGISIIVAIYVGVTSDASSAFGLGAFLAALVAIYIPHQYFAWKEKLN